MSYIEESRREIQVANPRRIDHTRGQQTRGVSQHWYAHGRLEGIALIDEAMIANQEAGVAVEHYQSLFLEIVLAKVRQYPPETVVDRTQRPVVLAHVFRQGLV